MLHEHKHEHCPHLNVKYCPHCDVVYCKDCGREWGTKYNWVYYPYTTTPYWDSVTVSPCNLGNTITNGEINVTCSHT